MVRQQSLEKLKPSDLTKPSTKGVTFRLSTEKLEQLRKAADARNAVIVKIWQ